MAFFQLRRARLRGLVEGLIQKVRSEATENDAKDSAERFQDYGLATNPVDGQGLQLSIDGHTIILRMDRLAERPQLAAYEVALWHKDGHKITLKADGLVEIEGKALVVNMSESIALNSPVMTNNGVNVGGTHGHGGVEPGDGRTSTPS
jgi:phage gp45-like